MGGPCNLSFGVGNGTVQYAYKSAYLSLWAFSTPYTGSQAGYEVARSGTLNLLVANPNTPPEPGVWIGYGKDFVSAPIAPLVNLPNGTWYLLRFEVDAATGQVWTYGNLASPLVIGSPPPPPPPPAPPQPSAIAPQVGLWWNPNESGSGYALDYKHGTLIVTVYSYLANGLAQWYIATGPVSGFTFSGTLIKTLNGQCISCAYQAPVLNGSDGTMTIVFSSPTAATMSLPGGRVFQIQPQDF